ncbi:hypothetical protein ACOMHN_057140 [Nucella lapillus]
MPHKCAVVGCLNRSDNKDRWVVMPHVTELLFHSCPDPEHVHIWTELITGGHRRPRELPAHTRVCSNHFPQGRPCSHSPFPAVYLSGYEDGDDQVTFRILSDTMNTDHDYLKLSYAEESEKLGRLVLVSGEEELEEKAVKEDSQLEDTVPARMCGVKDSAQCGGDRKGSGPNSIMADELSTVSAKHQPPSANRGRDPCAAKLSQAKHQPVSPANLKGRKRRNSRDTDHIYNTRTSKSAKCSQAKKVTDRSTDHMYNSRKEKTLENSCPQTGSNRYTDHMYNMTRTKLNELNNSAASGHGSDVRSEDGPSQETSFKVDKRVVDKDHMYQHSVRKNRNRLDNKNSDSKNSQMQSCALAKKQSKQEGKNANVRNEEGQAKQTGTKSENNLLPGSASKTGNRTCSRLARCSRKPLKSSVKRRKTSAVSKDSLTEDTGSDKAVATASTATASPVHDSDNESDHACEDDSRRTGAWHTDHMYVHLNTDILERKGQPALTPCFSVEGYKQEHSYANSVEVHYDACVNCSQLVQQLIGTIRQQGDHIDELKKKLHAANARNQQLASMFGQKSENLE